MPALLAAVLALTAMAPAIVSVIILLLTLHRIETRLMSSLSDLQAAVAAQTSVTASAVTLIQGLATEISAAAASNDSAALEQLASQLQSSTASLAAAVSANTPAAGPTPAAPTSPAAPVAPPAAPTA
jgi:cell division septation protein DedD